MSIDVNSYLDGALVGIEEQINAVHNHMPRVLKAYRDNSAFEEAMDKLEKLLRTASDSVEIFQKYTGQYDRFSRQCWGAHPGCYEVQCRLCEVQRLCCEETAKRNLERGELPEKV